MKSTKTKNETAFTLIEIIAVIIIIGIVALIAIPSIARYVEDSRNTAYISYEQSMEDAAKNIVIKCMNGEEPSCDIPAENERDLIYLSELVNKGYVELMKNPSEEGFCDDELSYVEVTNTGRDYEYSACLYCGQYKTDKALCTTYTYDGDDPVCGTITGQPTAERWTNQNRTISVQCSDATTGCTRLSYSKTFTTTTKTSFISIADKSGKKVECPVNVYVDKTPPTCDINVEGRYDNDLQWYTGDVQVELRNWQDTDSKVLTYGIGTSLENKNYNKETSVDVRSGITTVVGYVKDNAGNEGICAKTIRTGVEKPKFDFSYEYQLYPNGEAISYDGISANGTTLTTTNTTPKMTISNLERYTNVDRVIITLSSGASTGDYAYLNYIGNSGYGNGTVSTIVTNGSNEIIFMLPKGSYKSFTIQLGTKRNINYYIDKITVLSSDGGIFTNKDVGVRIDPIDTGVRTVAYSYNNGATFKTSPTESFTANTANKIITKNSVSLLSEPVDFMITGIDTSNPTVSIKVTKKGTNTEVTSGSWSTKELEFTLTSANVGISGATIYYCVDENNTCSPTTRADSGVKVTATSNKVGKYYIRYKITNAAGTSSSVASFNAKVDTTTPKCTIASNNTSWTNQNVTLTISGQAQGASSIASYSWDNSTFNSTNTKSVGSNATYTGYVKNEAGTTGSCTIKVENIDKTTPTCSISASGTNWTNQNITLTVTGSNPGPSPVDSYSWDNGSTYGSTTTNSVGSNNTYTVKIKNKAGTVGSCSYNVTNIDKTAPTCTPTKSNTNSPDGVTVTFTCDNNSGGSQTNCPGKDTGVKANKEYTVTDAAGNSAKCSVTVNNKKQQSTKSCTAGNTCESSAFGTHDCNCQTCNKTCTSESVCGCQEYNTYDCNCQTCNKTCTSESVCGCQTYNTYDCNCQTCNGSCKTAKTCVCSQTKKCSVVCKCLKKNGQYANIVSGYYEANCNLGNGKTYCAGFCQRKGNKDGWYVSTRTQYEDNYCTSESTCGCQEYNTYSCNCQKCNGSCKTAKTCTAAGCGTYSCNCQKCNGTCKTAKTCTAAGCGTYSCNCQKCNNSGNTPSVCGCKTWGNFGGWTDNNNCTAGESSDHTTTTQCRVVYY